MFKVITPATTANIGSGFDILGLSLNIYNEFEVERSEKYEFFNFEEKYCDPDNNLIIESYRYVCKQLKEIEVPIKLTINQNIQNSRGLGSSSSCIVAGILIAEKIFKTFITDNEKLQYATILEGHPDNVAPCLFGGLVASHLFNKGIFKSHYPFNENLNIYIAIPDFQLSTQLARSVLPKKISLKNCIDNSSNILVLLKGLETSDECLVEAGIKDYLHTSYRSPLINDYDKVKNIINSNTTISGSGPTMLTITSHNLNISSIQNQLNELDNKWEFLKVEIDNRGAFINE
jgi:homoserine kinase